MLLKKTRHINPLKIIYLIVALTCEFGSINKEFNHVFLLNRLFLDIPRRREIQIVENSVCLNILLIFLNYLDGDLTHKCPSSYAISNNIIWKIFVFSVCILFSRNPICHRPGWLKGWQEVGHLTLLITLELL